MLGDRALRLRQPHPLVFLLALDVDPAQLRGENRCGAGLLDRTRWFLLARALVRERHAAHTPQGHDAHRPPLPHRTTPRCRRRPPAPPPQGHDPPRPPLPHRTTPCCRRAAPAPRRLIPRSRRRALVTKRY